MNCLQLEPINADVIGSLQLRRIVLYLQHRLNIRLQFLLSKVPHMHLHCIRSCFKGALGWADDWSNRS